MATFNLDAVAGSVLSELIRPQLAFRWERHYNILAPAGLAVGDTVYADIVLPPWVRTLVLAKRTNTANADVLSAVCQDPGLPIAPVLPIKTASAVQTGGSSSNAANNAVLMQLFPIGNLVRFSLQFVLLLPAQGVMTIAMYDY